MATLRTFQTEIEEIQHREIVKQRGTNSFLAERPLPKDAKNIEPPAAGLNTTGNADGLKKPTLPGDDESLSIRRDELESVLLSMDDSNYEHARKLVAAFLMNGRGECLLKFGSQLHHASMFFPDSQNPPGKDDWTGTSRTEEELEKIKQDLCRVTDDIGAKLSVLYSYSNPNARMALLLRLPSPSIALTPEVRCAVVGNVDSGKSTTLGVLTRGALDDGRGRARVGLFRHKHEIESGRTSSVGMEILGFDPDGLPILPATANSTDPDVVRREKLGWEQISAKAAKIVSFIDLAGHERYLKTTLYGLTSGAPSCVILMVGANAGLIGMSKEHLAIALALNVPVVVCVTKIDMTPSNILETTIKQIVKILKSPGCRKVPVFVKSLEVAVELSQAFAKERLCPIFQLSNVTGEGLDFVRTFLNLLPSSEGDEQKFSRDQPLEYSITEVWSVPYVGTVVNGILNAGQIKTGDTILLGPDANGGWQTTIVRSMQRKRANVNTADAGQCVSLALKRVRRTTVRKGMVIVGKTDTPPRAVRRFEGQVLILYHNTTLQKNYQAMLHCGAIRQTVRIVSMDHPQGILRTGDRATVEFEFISHPEFVKEGMKLLFREGKTKGLGVITRLL